MARICVIRQYRFPLDARVRREVQALLDAGHEVDVICLRGPEEPATEHRDRLHVRRLHAGRTKGSPLRYVLGYARFFLVAAALVTAWHARRRYDIVQVHSLPDVLVFAAFVPRLFGARVLLDLHETMPEFFATKYGAPMDSFGPRVLVALEQASIRFAGAAITCTDQMRDAFVSRGADPAKVTVVLNGSDEGVFDPTRRRARNGDDGEFRLITHGTVEERYGIDTAVQAVARLAPEWPGLRLLVYGDGGYLAELERMAADLGVADRVFFSRGFVPLDDVVQAVADADAGLVAMKRDAFRDLALCNKMYDFIAMRKPAIVSRTRSVEAYFGDSAFALFEAEDHEDLARAIRRLADEPALGDQLVDEAARLAESHRWPVQRERYLGVVDRLLG